jgi:3-phosphoshikimate 1-carboxyvinyltransferase
MTIRPARRLEGTVSFPGDKSISHRAAIIASLAQGPSLISNFSNSSDCASTLSCLKELGVKIERKGNTVCVDGVGIGGLHAPTRVLDCGNSGSTMRLLAGVLAGHNLTSTLSGDESLRSRPMRRIIEPLEKMGACVASEDGKPPLRIDGRQPLEPMAFDLPIASAQVKTCVLLAGLHAHGRTEVVEQAFSTRDHTERMLQWFALPVEITENSGTRRCAVVGPANFKGVDVRIPGDFSTAAFFIAAAALLPGSDLTVEEVGLNPTRIQFLETLRSFGADIEVLSSREDCNEPLGTIRVRGPRTSETRLASSSGVIGGGITSSMIDELTLLAVAATQMAGGLEIRDARELRVKESDRIAATIANLRAMGANVEELVDGLVVSGPVNLKGAKLDSHGDHRIAMAFSVAALLAEGESEILRTECVAVSFPKYYEVLESLVER